MYALANSSHSVAEQGSRTIPALLDPAGLDTGGLLTSTAPRRMGGGAGGRQAAWGLLRDQIRSCVPPSPSIRRA